MNAHHLRSNSVTSEEAIAGSLQAIDEEFAEINVTERGDFFKPWCSALLKERPIIVLSVLETCTRRPE